MTRLVRFNNDSFDYEILSADEAKTLRKLAIDVQARGRVLTRMAVNIGRDLLTAKGFLDHGNFEDWCRSEAGLSPRTAQSYMSLAGFAKGDRAAVTGLALTAACRLAAPSTPDQVIEKVLCRVKRGEKVTLGEIDDLLWNYKNKEVGALTIHPEDLETAKICALIDGMGAALAPSMIEQLSAFFDKATPASFLRFKAGLRARLVKA
jgi:hypothetical protein